MFYFYMALWITLSAAEQVNWKLARTLATNMGMGNEWLAEQGLISLPQAKRR